MRKRIGQLVVLPVRFPVRFAVVGFGDGPGPLGRGHARVHRRATRRALGLVPVPLRHELTEQRVKFGPSAGGVPREVVAGGGVGPGGRRRAGRGVDIVVVGDDVVDRGVERRFVHGQRDVLEGIVAEI